MSSSPTNPDFPPINPQVPPSPQPVTPPPGQPPGVTPSSQEQPPSQGSDLSNSPFAKMFPGGATPQELRQFLNNFLKMMIYEFKQSDDAWQQSQEQLKKVAEGEDPDQ